MRGAKRKGVRVLGTAQLGWGPGVTGLHAGMRHGAAIEESAPLLSGLFKAKSEYSGGRTLKTAMFFISLLILVIDSGNGPKTGPMIQKQNSMREEGFLKHAL